MCNVDHSYAFLACNHTAWLCTQTVCSYTLFSKVTLSALRPSCSLCCPNLYTTLHLPQSPHYHALTSSPLRFGLPIAICQLPSRFFFSSGTWGPHILPQAQISVLASIHISTPALQLFKRKRTAPLQPTYPLPSGHQKQDLGQDTVWGGHVTIWHFPPDPWKREIPDHYYHPLGICQWAYQLGVCPNPDVMNSAYLQNVWINEALPNPWKRDTWSQPVDM